MASRNAYILGGVAAVAAIVGVAVALKVWQENASQREEDSKASDPSPSIEKRAVPGGSDSVPSAISRDEAPRDLAQPSVGADLVLQENDEAKPEANTASQADEAQPSSGQVTSAPAVDQAEPSVSCAAAKNSKTNVSANGKQATTATTATTPVATSSLEDSVVVVSKEQVKLDDSFVQVTKPETDATPKVAASTAGSSSEAEPAVTPKRTRNRNRKNKKNANVSSPTGTATLLETSLDTSVSSEGVAAVDSPGRVNGTGTGPDNPQDDSNGGGGGGENRDASSTATAPAPAKDLSAIAKSHQKPKKHHIRGGPKSPAAAAAVKEIQSSTASSATKKKSRNRNKSGSGAAGKQASPHH